MSMVLMVVNAIQDLLETARIVQVRSLGWVTDNHPQVNFDSLNLDLILSNSATYPSIIKIHSE